MLTTARISSDISIRSVGPLVVPREVEGRVAQVWEDETSRRSVFNGKVWSFVGQEGNEIQAAETDYQHFLTQLRCPELYSQMNIRMLAVSGVTRWRDRIAVGKRSPSVTMDPGLWELMPSGGIDRVSAETETSDFDPVRAQLFAELQEELGVTREQVNSMRPFAMVEDAENHVIDLGVEIELNPELDLSNLHDSDDEYSAVRWLNERELSDCPLIEVSAALLKLSER